MPISNHKDKHFEQITVAEPGFDRSALLTRFYGQRTWSVRGRDLMSGLTYPIICHNGLKEEFTRKDALRMAKRFVVTGNEWL
jgi:hypothetical protein